MPSTAQTTYFLLPTNDVTFSLQKTLCDKFLNIVWLLLFFNAQAPRNNNLIVTPYLQHCSEMRNLRYFIYMKTQSCFFHFSFHTTLFVSLMNALVYVDNRHRPGHSLGKQIKQYKMKNEKDHFGFLYT